MDVFKWIVSMMIFAMKTQDICCANFKLTILHTSDVRSRIEEIDKFYRTCKIKDVVARRCYGGMQRLKTKIQEMRNLHRVSLLLDAGNWYRGSTFFQVHGGQMLSDFMNLLGYDAMALGSSEFDRSPEGLAPFVNKATFPILSSNIDTSKTPILSRVKKSVVLEVDGMRIGVIGHTTIRTPLISKPGKVTFSDEVSAVQREANLLTKKGVNIIIAMGTSGIEKDRALAKNVKGLDIVVGGNQTTFMYSGKPPSRERPTSDYPTVVKSSEGKRVLIVHDFAFAKYLGFLEVEFDEFGDVVQFNGNPQLLDNRVRKDQGLKKVIDKYQDGVTEWKNSKAGETLVNLDSSGNQCRLKECNIGNLITDAMVYNYMKYTEGQNWNQAAIAFVNSGGIRASIGKGEISKAHIFRVLPFSGEVNVVQLSGAVLWEVFEHSAANWVATGELSPKFLQVSGLQITYDMSRQPGNRVNSIDVVCSDCPIPKFEVLNETKKYEIVVDSFLSGGGDGYDMIKNNIGDKLSVGKKDSDILLNYVQKFSPISHGIENRIKFMQERIGKNQYYDYCQN